MRIVYTKHAEFKFRLLKERGWNFTKKQINNTIKNPNWLGRTKMGQVAAMTKLNADYILRVIYDKIGNNVRVITFHPARCGRYEIKI